MSVPMMRVGKVMMRMSDPLVPVSMSMSCARRYGPVVLMLMMFIVRMLVLVFEPGMRMVVHVPLAQVQPNAGGH